ncbi:hypothetical protein HX037_10120 [Ignatzschineria indica]|uniref:hypothetical protein n=1 Tax=Ignatzschineria indica TaxID=472583 RepID=UPI00257841F1|nr:hypothetical protein [Ignatzschineria indica]MDM1546221.1 hypothetical protein [Ignatzschineria indica]
MRKIQRNFRIDQNLDLRLKDIANEQGLSVSQLIELACYSFADKTKSLKKNSDAEAKKDKQLTVYMRTDSQTYRNLKKIIEEKNNSFSQEINFRLRASLTNDKFDMIEFNHLGRMMIDINRLGNLLKMRMNQNHNEQELLEEIRKSILDLRQEFQDVILKSRDRV